MGGGEGWFLPRGCLGIAPQMGDEKSGLGAMHHSEKVFPPLFDIVPGSDLRSWVCGIGAWRAQKEGAGYCEGLFPLQGVPGDHPCQS